jgi:low density lipoprotein-related protein 2
LNVKPSIYYFKIYKSIYDEITKTIRQPTVIIDVNLIGPLSIALDWINDKLYVAEKVTSRIDVFTTDGRMRTNLLTADIYAPTSLALDPINSYLFYTDAGGSTKRQPPKIERAFMDGTQRMTLIADKLLEPVGITLDLIKKQIFWLDKKYDHIESCDYNGLKRHVVASGSHYLPHAINLAIFENTIFYADTTKLGILKFPRHTYYTDANITYHYKSQQSPKAMIVYHEAKQMPRLSPCTTRNDTNCEHFCLLSHTESQSANAYRCKCKIGYQLRRDLKSCELVTEYIYMTQANLIRAIPLDNQPIMTEVRVPVVQQRGGSIRAIEADCRLNRTFFYDGLRRAVFQTGFAGDEPRVLIANNIMSTEGLAYDWISRNLYLTDYNKVTVVQTDNVMTRRDITSIQGGRLFQIVVDPNAGYIFFTDVQRPARIYRALTDGTNLTTIRSRELSMPQALAIDYQLKRLYWADANLAKIQYSNYAGNNLITLMTPILGNPVSLFVFKQYLYYVDARTSSLYKVYKYFGASPTPIRSNLNNLDKVRVFAKDLQTVADNHPCARQNGDCSHFCFPIPSPDQQYALSRHCGCPYGYKLDTNMATCILNIVDEPLVETCLMPFFKCSNGRCVR